MKAIESKREEGGGGRGGRLTPVQIWDSPKKQEQLCLCYLNYGGAT